MMLLLFVFSQPSSAHTHLLAEIFGTSVQNSQYISDGQILEAVGHALELSGPLPIQQVLVWTSMPQLGISLLAVNSQNNFLCSIATSASACSPVAMINASGSPLVIPLQSIMDTAGAVAPWVAVGAIAMYVAKKIINVYNTGSLQASKENHHSIFQSNSEMHDDMIVARRDLKRVMQLFVDGAQDDLLAIGQTLVDTSSCRVPEHDHRINAKQVVHANPLICEAVTPEIVVAARHSLAHSFLGFARAFAVDLQREFLRPLKTLYDDAQKLGDPLVRRQIATAAQFATARTIAEKGVVMGVATAAVIGAGTAAFEAVETMVGVHACHVGNMIVLGTAAAGYSTYFCARHLLPDKQLSFKEKWSVFKRFFFLNRISSATDLQTDQQMAQLSQAERQLVTMANLLRLVEKSTKGARNLDLISRSEMKATAKDLGILKKDLNHLVLQSLTDEKRGLSSKENEFLNWLQRLKEIESALPGPLQQSSCAAIFPWEVGPDSSPTFRQSY